MLHTKLNTASSVRLRVVKLLENKIHISTLFLKEDPSEQSL